MVSTSAQPVEREIPRVGWRGALRGLLAAGGMRRDMLTGLRAQYENFGPVVAVPGRESRLVHLFGPDANRFVLLDPQRIFSARRPWMGIMGQIFPNGLLLLDGTEHQHHRRIMHEAFVRSALHTYAERMNPLIEADLQSWAAAGPRLRAYGRFKALTLNLAAQIFLGVELGSGAKRVNRAFERMVAASMSRVRLRIPGLEFERGLRGREFMLEFLRGLLEVRRGVGPDMLSRLTRARDTDGNAFAQPQILDHMVFLMMAAHDTTTSALTSITYELARHPAWQDRVREESFALGVPHAGADEVERLTALTWVMREALRLYPPLPLIPRVARESFEWSGYSIPAGAMVVLAPIHTHHMSEWWSEPFAFDPWRYSPERAEDERHSHSWLPFGAGSHACIGKRFAEIQIRAVMHQLVQRYRWSVPEGYRMPVQQAPISRPVDALPIAIERL